MIKIERVSVMNLENAIRGARNPLNSWGRSDSSYDENGNFHCINWFDCRYCPAFNAEHCL